MSGKLFLSYSGIYVQNSEYKERKGSAGMNMKVAKQHYDANGRMGFGEKFVMERFEDVPKSYLKWMWHNVDRLKLMFEWPGIYRYINDNLDAVEAAELDGEQW